MHLDPQALDLAAQQIPAHRIQLYRHQARRKFDDMSLQPQQTQGIGRLQPQQATTDYHTGASSGTGITDRFQIRECAIDIAAGAGVTRDRRHKGVRAGCQHQLVIAIDFTMTGGHRLGRQIQRLGGTGQDQLHALSGVPLRIGHLQLYGCPATKYFRQMHPVVGAVRLSPQHGHRKSIQPSGVDQLFNKVVSHHAVADHQQLLFVHPFFSIPAGIPSRHATRLIECSAPPRLG